MPWHIEADNPECSGYAVVKDSSGEVVGCHRTRTQAEAQLAALNIAEEEDEEDFDDEDDAEEEERHEMPNRSIAENILADIHARRLN
jgi:hypothetical protein